MAAAACPGPIIPNRIVGFLLLRCPGVGVVLPPAPTWIVRIDWSLPIVGSVGGKSPRGMVNVSCSTRLDHHVVVGDSSGHVAWVTYLSLGLGHQLSLGALGVLGQVDIVYQHALVHQRVARRVGV